MTRTSSFTALKAVGIFSVLNLLPSAVGIFLLPLYLNRLSPADYGSLALFNLFAGFYGVFANLKMGMAASVRYFDYEVEDRRHFTSTLFSVSTVLSTLAFLLFTAIGHFFFSFFLHTGSLSFFPFGWMILAATYFNQFFTIHFSVMRNELRLRELTVYTLSLLITNIVVQYYLIVFLNAGLEGAVWGSLISKIPVLLVFIWLNKGDFTLRFNVRMLKRALSFSLPFLPFVFMNWLLTASDRLLLEQYLELEDVGRYTLVINLSMLATLIFNAMNTAFRPDLFESFKNQRSEDVTRIRQLYSWQISIGILILSGIVLIGSNLDLLTQNERYLSVIPLFPLAAMVMVPELLVRIPNDQLLYKNQTRAISWSMLVSLVSLVIFLYFLIPVLELKGALMAVGLAKTINLGLVYLSNRKGHKYPLMIGYGLKMTCITFLGVILLYSLKERLSFSYNLFGFLQFALVLALIATTSFDSIKKGWKALQLSKSE